MSKQIFKLFVALLGLATVNLPMDAARKQKKRSSGSKKGLVTAVACGAAAGTVFVVGKHLLSNDELPEMVLPKKVEYPEFSASIGCGSFSGFGSGNILSGKLDAAPVSKPVAQRKLTYQDVEQKLKAFECEIQVFGKKLQEINLTNWMSLVSDVVSFNEKSARLSEDIQTLLSASTTISFISLKEKEYLEKSLAEITVFHALTQMALPVCRWVENNQCNLRAINCEKIESFQDLIKALIDSKVDVSSLLETVLSLAEELRSNPELMKLAQGFSQDEQETNANDNPNKILCLIQNFAPKFCFLVVECKLQDLLLDSSFDSNYSIRVDVQFWIDQLDGIDKDIEEVIPYSWHLRHAVYRHWFKLQQVGLLEAEKKDCEYQMKNCVAGYQKQKEDSFATLFGADLDGIKPELEKLIKLNYHKFQNEVLNLIGCRVEDID